jgi:hypothetical protein
MRTTALALVTAVLVGAIPPDASAQQAANQSGASDQAAVRTEIDRLKEELQALRSRYQEQLQALETRLAALESRSSTAAALPVAPEAPPAPASSGQEPTPQAPARPGSLTSKVFNPDIAVIGNTLGTIGGNTTEPSPAMRLDEAEVSLQAAVDPYARADFFLGFGEEGVEIEEGYLTFPALPGGLLLKTGRMYAAFGKVNQMHTHTLPWADRPLMNRNLVGGDEGFADAGVSISRLLPNPWFFLEATAEAYRGESFAFHAPSRGDLTYVGRLRAYRDVTESANVDLGTSVAFGHNDAGPSETTRLIGLDATFRYRPLRTTSRRFVARTELAWSRRSELSDAPSSFGAYLSGEYQFSRRWYGGLRLDYADRATDSAATDKGFSALLTFKPSEFSQVRGQYRRTRYAEGETANEFLVQFLFSIGAHGAHPF